MGLAESCHRIQEEGNGRRENGKYGRIEGRHLKNRGQTKTGFKMEMH